MRTSPNKPKFTRHLALGLGLCLLAGKPVVANESTLPELGDSVSGVVSPEQEYKLGRGWLRKLRAATPMVNDPLVQDYVERLCYRLAFHSPLTSPDFAVTLVDDTSINAFAVPGGVIGVNAGLILSAETEAEMASVLAHELGHLSQRHFARMLAENKNNQWLYLGALLASIAVAAKGDGQAGMALGASAQAALVQNQLSYSRLNEQEADRIGMQTLVDTGLDPHAMPIFFQRLQRQSGQLMNAPEFLMTHPVTQSRIADTLNRANQYPQKLAQDALGYQLVRVRMMVAYAEDTGSGIAHFRQALKDVEAGGDRWSILQLGLGLAQTRARQYDDARKTLAPLQAKDPQRIDYLLAMADIDFAEQKYADAASHLEKPLTLNPDSYPLLVYYARARIANNQAGLVINALEAAGRERPDDPLLWQLLADAYTGTKNTIGIYRSRAEVLFLRGNEDRALEQLMLAADQTKSNYPLNAKIQRRMREMQQAKSDMKL